MDKAAGAEDAAKERRARRVRLALCFANAVVLDKLCYECWNVGLRIPALAIEHWVALAFLTLPTFLQFSGRGDSWRRRGQVLRDVMALIAIGGQVLTGSILFFLLLMPALALESMGHIGPVLPLVPAVALLLLLLEGRGRRWTSRLAWLAWLPPWAAAGTFLLWMPPFAAGRLDDGWRGYVVETSFICAPSDPIRLVCSTTKLVPGLLEVWCVLDHIPVMGRVNLRLDGPELVIERVRDECGAGPSPGDVRRIRVR